MDSLKAQVGGEKTLKTFQTLNFLLKEDSSNAVINETGWKKMSLIF